MAATAGVIDWDEAMEQCGDDEEFLRELLADLRGETDAQVAKIEETIRVRFFFTTSALQKLFTLYALTIYSLFHPYNRTRPKHRFIE